MAIDRINLKNDAASPVESTKSANRQVVPSEVRSKEASEPKGDRVEISDRSREVQQIRGLIELTPDVRSEKVQATKQAIENNLYNVRGEQVADRIIGGGAILNSLG